ncbi:MAG: spermidine synthase, partial [Deltaproteobacteria bacterium]
RIDVIEIEPAVVAANRAIGSQRLVDPLADARVRVVVNDARSALLLSGERFDAIAAQASHPWTAGSSHLYTREFFALADARLADGGVFVQWIGAPFADEPLLKSLVATLLATWPHVQVYRPLGGDLLFAASHAPLARDVAWIRGELAIHPAEME